MPLIDITNPDTIKFLVESYDKTTRLCVKWNMMNAEKLNKAASLTRVEKGYEELGIKRDSMIAGMPIIVRDHINARTNRRRKAIRDGIHVPGIADLKKGHSIPEVELGDPKEDPRLARPGNNLSIDPVMRPIDPKQKEIVYKELPVFGREVYLKSRSNINPEKKYYFRECSGWDYGWRQGDSSVKNNARTFSREWRLTRGIKSRTGSQPDPDYYKSPDIHGPSKCAL
ncbi:Uncharacterized protein OBRU01_01489 [Operophtera brumata]|uniref:Sperm microtubule inner protein 1 C-terminal domain-containing protein n=1 Tax=Operophtera brumata TaxID=104452 RepID=A0A0L7LTU8_OPEBR|nr:Uncharacterized protein OBRU01_01489 [Operophtera brumata]